MFSSGPPRTVLPAEGRARCSPRSPRRPRDRNEAIAAVVAANPRSLFAWAGARRCRARRHRAVRRRIASDTTAGWTSCGPTAGAGPGYVRWADETNRGFLGLIRGLGQMAGKIGEVDEVERIGAVHPPTRSGWRAGGWLIRRRAVLCGGQQPADGPGQGDDRGRRPAMAAPSPRASPADARRSWPSAVTPIGLRGARRRGDRRPPSRRGPARGIVTALADRRPRSRLPPATCRGSTRDVVTRWSPRPKGFDAPSEWPQPASASRCARLRESRRSRGAFPPASVPCTE